jgi:hypothetical protein
MDAQIHTMSQASDQAAAAHKTHAQKVVQNMTQMQDRSNTEHISAAVADMVTRIEVDAVRREASEAMQRLITEYAGNRDADKKLAGVSAKMVKIEEDVGRVEGLVKRERERVDAVDEMVKMLAEQMSDEVCMCVCMCV